MRTIRTQVGIVGASPAGLLLGQLLAARGIESVILESRSRRRLVNKVSTGILDQSSVDLLRTTGLAARLDHEGIRHSGVSFAFGGARYQLDLEAFVGTGITIYDEHELARDLIGLRLASGGMLEFETAVTHVDDLETTHPTIHYVTNGARLSLTCDFIVGSDGVRGPCRAALPERSVRTYRRTHPWAWMGILVETPPGFDEPVYSLHERGFAFFSMRSTTTAQVVLQSAPRTDMADWSDERISEEVEARLETDRYRLTASGSILRRDFAALRSNIVEPVRHGRLFLAGDAAHVVPPTGAKGLNLALRDAQALAEGFGEYYRTHRTHLLDTYSDRTVDRAWKAERFSSWMASLLHRRFESPESEYRMQLAELESLTTSLSSMAAFAEAFVGTSSDSRHEHEALRIALHSR